MLHGPVSVCSSASMSLVVLCQVGKLALGGGGGGWSGAGVDFNFGAFGSIDYSHGATTSQSTVLPTDSDSSCVPAVFARLGCNDCFWSD